MTLTRILYQAHPVGNGKWRVTRTTPAGSTYLAIGRSSRAREFVRLAEALGAMGSARRADAAAATRLGFSVVFFADPLSAGLSVVE